MTVGFLGCLSLMAEVFISYSRTDAGFVRRLDDALVKVNRKAWVDWQDIPLTAEWLKEIYAGIEEADNFLFIISPESAASVACQKEVEHAAANNKRIIPILHRATPAGAVPGALGRLNWIYFRDSDDFDGTFASLIEALDTDLSWKGAHSRFLVRAKEWEREGRDKSFLLRGKDLREAEELQVKNATKEPKLTDLQSQYILASRQAETRRQRQQLGVLVFALLVTVALAVAALNQRNAARRQAAIATSRQLAAQSKSLVDKKLDLSILLALEADNSDDSFEAQSALFTAIQRQPRLKAFLRGIGNSPTGFHARRLNALAFSKDGSLIAAVGGLSSDVIDLWDANTRQHVATLEGHTLPVENLAFTADGKTLLSGGQDKVLIFWDVQARQPKAKLTDHPGMITSIAISPDGKIAATGDDQNNVILWDLATQSKIGSFSSPNTRTITHLLWRENNLITVGRKMGKAGAVENDEISEFWDITNFQRFGEPVERRVMAFSDDFGRFASVSQYEGESPFSGVQLHLPKISELTDNDSASTQPRSEGAATQQQQGSAAVLTAQATVEASRPPVQAASDSSTAPPQRALESTSAPAQETSETRKITVDVNDSHSGTSVGSESIDDDGPITSSAFSSDGLMLAFGDNLSIHMWDLAKMRYTDPLRAHQDIVDTVAFDPVRPQLASTGWDDAVILWDVASESALGKRLADAGGEALAYSPDGKTLASTSDEGGVVLYDARSGRTTARFAPKFPDNIDLDTPGWLTFSPKGTMLGVQNNRGVCLINLDNSTPEVPGQILGQATAVAFHPSGNAVAIGLKTGEVLLWDFSAHREKWRTPASTDSKPATALAFAPSGQEVAAGYSEGTLAFWDGFTGQSKSRYLRAFDDSGDFPATLVYSSNGKTLVATGHEVMTLWDAPSRTRVNTVSSRSIVGAPMVATFSPDAKILAWSTLFLLEVNLLDARARQQFAPPIKYPSGTPNTRFQGFAFSPDGKTLAVAYGYSSGKGKSQSFIFLWDFDVGAWRQRACAMANRNLTSEEWAQYLSPVPYRKTCSDFH